MLSLIEVTCPHCAAQGQIMLPPLGAIIIGPCPECNGMVAIFCGRALPLDNDIMADGTPDERRTHVGTVLGGFLSERIDRLFSGEESEDVLPFAGDEDPVQQDTEEAPDTGLGRIDVFGNPQESAITQEELESFKNVDLRLLDNPEYFKAIFRKL